MTVTSNSMMPTVWRHLLCFHLLAEEKSLWKLAIEERIDSALVGLGEWGRKRRDALRSVSTDSRRFMIAVGS